MRHPVEIDREDNTIRTVRQLRLSGNSIVVSIPKTIMQGAGLDTGDEVEVVGDMSAGEITIRKVDESDAEGDGDPPDS